MMGGAMADLKKVVVVLPLLLLLVAATVASGQREEWGFEGKSGRDLFMLEKAKALVKTEAGVVKVTRGYMYRGMPSTMHIGFINMEPNSLFLPQYLDANLILFIRRGEVRVGRIYKDDLVEKNLKKGDIYMIPAGTAFYMVNYGKGQTLHIICSIDTSESLFGSVPFQSFFIGGGVYPTSVLSGFDTEILTSALNVTAEELSMVMGRQTSGPIVYMTGNATDEPKRLALMMQKEIQKHQLADEDDEDEAEVEQEGENQSCTWRKVLNAIIGNKEDQNKKRSSEGPDSYNLYDRKPDFRNDYGWSVALDKHDYRPLKRSGIGIYLVNLTAGSMLAPHVNPVATEYGVVLGGSGTIQVVFPNGSSAMHVDVNEGDAFWIPRYFPFCQIASRSGAMEFFGFTTSARSNRPQFLVGASSILKSMNGPELAAAFNMSRERLDGIVNAQRESIILPSWPSPERKAGEEERERGREEERERGREEREEGGREEKGEGGREESQEGEGEPILIRKVGA